MSNLTELLNARHQDLDFELGALGTIEQLSKNVAKKLDIVSEVNIIKDSLTSRLMDKLNVDLEEIAEDEEIEVDSVNFSIIYDHLATGFFEAKTEMSSYLQLDNMINNIKRLGGTEEEVNGLYEFKKRLEKTVFERYEVTEKDLEEENE